MKILVVCQHYYPEPFRITDICEELVKMGNDVTVVTGLPNYPMGTIYDGYKSKEKRKEKINNVTIYRCFTIGRGKGVIKRFLNYYSFAISSSKFVKKIKEKYDVVFINQLSPVIMANAGIKYAKKHKIKSVLYCLDLWPASLAVGGVREGSLIYKYFHKVSKKIYRNVDKILVSSKSFVDYFKNEFYIKNVEYLPQYSEELFKPEICKKEPNGKLDLMFAGNIGKAQGVEKVIEFAKINQNSHVTFHVVGDGSELEKIKEQSKNIGNIIFYGRKDLSEMPKFYSMADAMIVSLIDDPILNMTLPGKVQTYMAAGKPILGFAKGETEIVIKDYKCGLNILNFNENEEKVLEYLQKNLSVFSSNSFNSYIKFFSKESFFKKLYEYFK